MDRNGNLRNGKRRKRVFDDVDDDDNEEIS